MFFKQFLFSLAPTYIDLAHRKLNYFKHLLIYIFFNELLWKSSRIPQLYPVALEMLLRVFLASRGLQK